MIAITHLCRYGWGDSFHFAPRYRGETFRESIARHEFTLAARLGLRVSQALGTLMT
jgi:sterol 24-C-methyltransferase